MLAVKEVEIIELCVAVGDAIEADEGIVTVETDKASMDIPAPVAGTLAALMLLLATKLSKAISLVKLKRVLRLKHQQLNQKRQLLLLLSQQLRLLQLAAKSLTFCPDIGEDGEVDISIS